MLSVMIIAKYETAKRKVDDLISDLIVMLSHLLYSQSREPYE